MELTSFQLKWIAILSMALDHTGALLFPEAMWMRGIGRLAFPIFAFLLAEGYYHTHDVKRYLLRLWFFALISEIPYDLAFQGTWLEFGSQNVFFTLGISLAVLELLGRSHEPAGQVIVLVCGFMIGEWAGVDYGFLGVLLPVIYGRFRESSFGRLCMGGLWNFLWQPGIQYLGVLASVPIGLYRGKQGRKMKYFFYLFYPVHLLILYGVGLCL